MNEMHPCSRREWLRPGESLQVDEAGHLMILAPGHAPRRALGRALPDGPHALAPVRGGRRLARPSLNWLGVARRWLAPRRWMDMRAPAQA